MCDVASLVITALVVHRLGSYKMKLKMMQYMGTREAGQAAAPFNHYERTAQEADLSFLYPAHFNHYTMFCRRGSIRSYKASWSPPCSPYSHTQCFVFLFKLLEFQTEKGSSILTFCLWKARTLWSLYLTHPLQGEAHFIKQKSPDIPQEGEEILIWTLITHISSSCWGVICNCLSEDVKIKVL